VKRRDLLRAAGAATALSFIPRGADAAWARVAAGYRTAEGLTAAQRALVGGIADVIFPRTDTPSATDVGVTDWVNLLVAEYYGDNVRTPFLQGLDAIDAQVRAKYGKPFAEIGAEAQREVVGELDAPAQGARGGGGGGGQSPERRAYSRLKGLVVHGYFTSQRVERDVLHVRMAYPKFEGAADHKPGARR
jgi:hypothetical protein